MYFHLRLMKLVTVKDVRPPVPGHLLTDYSYYTIHLGNGKVCQFTQSRQADAFLVATSTFLTDMLISVNEMYIVVFSEYRKLWFYFDGRKKDNLNEMQKTERKLRAQIDIIQHTFDNIHRNRISGGNSLPFKLIAEALGAIHKAAKVLVEMRKKRSEYVEKVMLENLRKNCFFLLREMADYGQHVNYTQHPDSHVSTILNKLTDK